MNPNAANKRGRPSKWPPERLPSKFADFECAFFPLIPWRNVTPKDPLFWRGFSGTNSGGPFAPGRFCSLPRTRIWGRILGCEFLSPEYWGRILGSKFLGLCFPIQRAPSKIHPQEIDHPKFTHQKFHPRIRAEDFTLHFCRAILLTICVGDLKSHMI